VHPAGASVRLVVYARVVVTFQLNGNELATVRFKVGIYFNVVATVQIIQTEKML